MLFEFVSQFNTKGFAKKLNEYDGLFLQLMVYSLNGKSGVIVL